ncbi:MAG: hypothetical protein MJ094_01770 [Saccharofermentans sp.]|nr:hypothetical protein [Saccharofermentans sp.]
MLCCFISNVFLKDSVYIIEIVAFANILIAAIGMFYVLEKLINNRILAIIGALAWSYNTFNIFIGRSWIIVILVSAMVPWIFLGTTYLYDHLSYKSIIFSAIPKVLLFYYGHPQFFIWGMIFDVLTAILYYVLTDSKNQKNKKFIALYFLSFIPVIVLCLPLIGPMWNLMQISSSRTGAFDFATFSNPRFSIKSLLTGVLYPFIDPDNLRSVINRSGHFTYLLIGAYICGIVLIFKMKKGLSRNRLIALYTISLIVLLSSSSETVCRLIYLIPIMNRFRWPFKYYLWFPFFAVLISTLVLNMLISSWRLSQKAKNVLAYTSVGISVINIVIICCFVPLNYFGLIMRSNLRDVPDYLDDTYLTSRYLCIGENTYSYDENQNQTYGLDIYQMTSDVSLYFKYSNVLGYDVLTPMESADRLIDTSRIFTAGLANPSASNFIEQLNFLGVDTLVIENDWATDNPDILINCNLESCFDNGEWTVYKNFDALPVARTSDNNPIDYSFDINNLQIKTTSDYQGGEVLVMFSYDSNFVATCDGNIIPINKNTYNTISVDVPAGEHTVEFKYQDKTFYACCLISACSILIMTGIGLYISKNKK